MMNNLTFILIAALSLLMPGLLRAVDLQQQIDDAIAAGQRELTIAPGTYRLPARPRQPQLLIRNAKDLTIIADDVTIIATSLDQAVVLQDCRNVEIRGLTIDYDPLPFTQGVVVAMAEDHTWFDVRIDAGYPTVEADQGRRAILYDPQTRLVKPGTWTRYSVTVTPREDGIARISWGRPIRDTAAAGDLVTITRRTNTPHGLFLNRSHDCTLRNVTLHTSTSFGFFETHGGGNQYLGCTVRPGPTPAGATAPRLLSSQADSFHSKHTTRGPRVEDCTFDSMGDDGIAINGSFALVAAAEDNRVIVSPQQNLPFEVGDRLHGVSRTGLPTPDAKVVSITPIPTDQAPDAKAIQLRHYPDLRRAETAFRQCYEVVLDQPLALSEGDLVASPDRNGSGFVVRNNKIRNTRARGLLIKASYGVIENNTVEHIALAGIVLCPETRFWHEADYSTDVIIRGNTLRQVNIGAINPGAIQAGAITLTAEGDGKSPSPAGGHRNILIEGNRVENSVGLNLMLTSANDVTVRNNTFVNPHAVPGGNGKAFGVDPQAIIWISHAADITVMANTVENPGPHAGQTVVTTDTVENVHVQ